MERECLLTVLMILLGGIALHAIPAWRGRGAADRTARERERLSWLELWSPLASVSAVAAWLIGWALASPDPVPAHVGAAIFIGFAPFAIACARAGLRAAWSLMPARDARGIATVGLIWPRITVDANLAQRLDRRALAAALAHEEAHARHRDPLRIWLGQLATDLQWPRASARRRFQAWLGALEQARDEEARAAGVEGADLAAAVLASLRFHAASRGGICAPVTGGGAALRERIERLMQPLPGSASASPSVGLSATALASILMLGLGAALALGLAFGGPVIAALLAATS
jgi:hypothetical protein